MRLQISVVHHRRSQSSKKQVFVSKNEENRLEPDQAAVVGSQAVDGGNEGEERQSTDAERRPVVRVTEHSRTSGGENLVRDWKGFRLTATRRDCPKDEASYLLNHRLRECLTHLNDRSSAFGCGRK